MAVKGVFFTISSVLLVALMVSAVTVSYRYVSISTKVPVIKARVTQSNNYVYNLEHNLLERALTDAGYRATLSLIGYMNKTRNFSKNVYTDYREIMLYGKVNYGKANEMDLGALGIIYMQGHTLPDVLEKISNLSRDELHINTTFTSYNVSVYQDNTTTPFEIGFELNITFFVNATVAIWNGTRTIRTKVSIEGVDDPYYNLNSGGKFVPKIRAADIGMMNVSANASLWNFTMFIRHLDETTYAWEIKAPNFLTRMENRTDASECCGIESLINPNRMGFNTTGTDIYMSYVDYCFYGKNCPGSMPNNMSLWTELCSDDNVCITSDNPKQKYYKFKLEQYHIVKYNLTEYQGEKVHQEP